MFGVDDSVHSEVHRYTQDRKGREGGGKREGTNRRIYGELEGRRSKELIIEREKNMKMEIREGKWLEEVERQCGRRQMWK